MPGAAYVALGLLALAWLGPLPQLARHSFAAHMALHMTLVAGVAPLVALGLSGSRFDPVKRAPRWCAAIPASLVELVIVWSWHVPLLHVLARQHSAVFALEQVSFLAAGCWLWISALGGDARQRPLRAGAGIVALVLTFAHMTLLAALLMLSPRAVYGHAGSSPMAALADQELGGVIMVAATAGACLPAVLALATRLLRYRALGSARP